MRVLFVATPVSSLPLRRTQFDAQPQPQPQQQPQQQQPQPQPQQFPAYQPQPAAAAAAATTPQPRAVATARAAVGLSTQMSSGPSGGSATPQLPSTAAAPAEQGAVNADGPPVAVPDYLSMPPPSQDVGVASTASSSEIGNELANIARTMSVCACLLACGCCLFWIQFTCVAVFCRFLFLLI